MKKKKAKPAKQTAWEISWEPPPLDPRKFHDPYRKKAKVVMVRAGPGVRKGQIMRRVADGILYLAS